MVFFASALVFAIAAGILDSKRQRKRKHKLSKNGEPASKRFKHAESSESSSTDDDDDDTSDSESSFDIFSSDSESESGDSSFEEASNSEVEDIANDSDIPQSQDDISIKEEPIYESDFDVHSENGEEDSKSHIEFCAVGPEIKTEVLDNIIDGVEVDQSAILDRDEEVKVKEEPLETVESSELMAVVIKEEPITDSTVGSSSDPAASAIVSSDS